MPPCQQACSTPRGSKRLEHLILPSLQLAGGLWVCRYQHRLFYDILVYRRPDKLVNLGNGILYINIPVMA